MTILRCTAKLLKRLHKPAKPPEPEPQSNPLGEWYADFDYCRRIPFVVMLNAATGAVLVLPGHADGLRRLNELALTAFTALCMQHELKGSEMSAELHGFASGFACAATRDRSVLGSLNERKFACWMHMEHGESLLEAASSEWEGLFKHPALGRDERFGSDYHRPLDLLRQRLMPAADILPFRSRQKGDVGN